MLGAAHALANPLTAAHRVVHGQAVGLMLPHVVRHNAAACADHYAVFLHDLGIDAAPAACGDRLADWLAGLLRAAGLAGSFAELGLATPDTLALAEAAAAQWTAGFNPRPVAAADLARLYEAAR
jgi:alcohol dehydrogenase